MDVAASGQVHECVCAPDGRPLQLLYLLCTCSTGWRNMCAAHRLETAFIQITVSELHEAWPKAWS